MDSKMDSKIRKKERKIRHKERAGCGVFFL
jgi:hypothetical protein